MISVCNKVYIKGELTSNGKVFFMQQRVINYICEKIGGDFQVLPKKKEIEQTGHKRGGVPFFSNY